MILVHHTMPGDMFLDYWISMFARKIWTEKYFHSRDLDELFNFRWRYADRLRHAVRADIYK